MASLFSFIKFFLGWVFFFFSTATTKVWQVSWNGQRLFGEKKMLGWKPIHSKVITCWILYSFHISFVITKSIPSITRPIVVIYEKFTCLLLRTCFSRPDKSFRLNCDLSQYAYNTNQNHKSLFFQFSITMKHEICTWFHHRYIFMGDIYCFVE